MSNIGYATLSVIPSARGFGTALTKSAVPEMAAAGKAGGLAFSKAAVLGVAAVGVAVVGSLFAVGKTMHDMESTIRVGTGKTGAALDGLVGSAKNVGRGTAASMEDVGKTITGLNVRLGLTGPVLENLSKQFLAAGRITKQSLDMNTVTSSFTAFGIKGKDTSKALDNLFQISQATGVGINELAAAASKGAPAFRQFGLSFSDSAALIGVLDKAGINSGKTIAALTIGLTKFAKEGKAPGPALRATIDQITAFTKKGQDAKAVNLAAGIFGTRGAASFVAAVKSGKVNLDDMMKSTGAGKDTILTAAKAVSTFGGKWNVFKNNVLIALEPVATRVFKAFGDGMQFMSDVGLPALQKYGAELSAKLLPAMQSFDTFLTGSVIPAIKLFGTALAIPAVVALGSFLFGTLVPALVSVVTWMNRNRTAVEVTAGIITTLLLPAIIRWGVQSTIAAARSVAAWVTSKASAVSSIAFQVAGNTLIALGWVRVGVAAMAGAGRVVAAWALSKLGAAGTLVLYGVAFGFMAAGWIATGVAAMAGAAVMAAAWLLSIWPIALVVVTVVAIAVIIVKNWNKIKSAVVGAVKFVINFVKGNWPLLLAIIAGPIALAVLLVVKNWARIKSATSSAFNFVRGIISSVMGSVRSSVSGAIGNVVAIFSGLLSKIKGALSGAKSALGGVGKDIVNGLIVGIKSMGGAIGRALVALLPGPLKKFAGKLGIASPSRVFAAFGRFVGEGFVQGIVGTRKHVEATFVRLANLASDTHSKGIKRLVANAKPKLLALAKVYESTVARSKVAIASLNKLQTSAASLRSSVTDAILATGASAGGSQTFAGLISSLTSANTAAKDFAVVLGQLKTAGLNSATLGQLIEAGPSALVAAKNILGAGAAGVGQVNALQTSLGKSATALGKTAADAMYGAGINAAKGLVNGLKSQESTLAKQMRRLASVMADAIKKKLGIASPSKVFAGYGINIGQGLVLGVDKSRGGVEASMSRLVSSVTMPSGAKFDPSTSISGTSSRGTAPTLIQNIHPQPGQSETEVGRAAANKLLWAMATA